MWKQSKFVLIYLFRHIRVREGYDFVTTCYKGWGEDVAWRNLLPVYNDDDSKRQNNMHIIMPSTCCMSGQSVIFIPICIKNKSNSLMINICYNLKYVIYSIQYIDPHILAAPLNVIAVLSVQCILYTI